MMNMFSQAESLKDFSQEQLLGEMQNPSGSAPQFLVLSEIQRRAKARQEMANPQAPSSTVAQDAVNAAGMPQAGLGGMMQAMAPQTNIAQNTAQNPADNSVQKMAEGGLAGVSRNLRDYGLSADPAIMMMAGRSGVSVPEYIAAMQPEARAQNERRVQRNRMLEMEPVGDGMAFPTQGDLDADARNSAVGIGTVPAQMNAPSEDALPFMPSDDTFMPSDMSVMPAPNPRSPDSRVGGDTATVDQYLSAIPLGPVTEGMTPMDERAANLAQNRATDVIDARMGSDAEATANMGPVDMGATNTLRPWAAAARDKIQDTAAAIMSPFGADVPAGPGEEDLSIPRPQARPTAPPGPAVTTPPGPTVRTAGGGASVSALTSGLPNDMVTDADKALESDYWLALAKFGAALGAASGGGTTFGQDVGSAGTVGLAAVDQARADYEQRKKDAQKLAMEKAKFEMDMRVANARLAAAGRSGGDGGAPSMDPMSASWYNALVGKRDGIMAELNSLPPPEEGGLFRSASDPAAAERMRLNRELQLANLQLQVGEGSTGLPVLGIQGVNPNVIDTTQ